MKKMEKKDYLKDLPMPKSIIEDNEILQKEM